MALERLLVGAKAFSGEGGVCFVFEMPLEALEEMRVEASSSLAGGGGGSWRLLREGEEYNIAWETKQAGVAQVTITLLPPTNAQQTFLRLSTKN